MNLIEVNSTHHLNQSTSIWWCSKTN